ncbi:biopolymer transporter ExbD [Candidatus Poribacteria bacterium]|nr:biopolymer transporter ExbD [Candidatus Poribacteria bacterium]
MKNRFFLIIIGVLAIWIVAALLVLLIYQPKVEFVIKISNPEIGESEGAMTLNDMRIQFDEMLNRFDKRPDNVKTVLIIHADSEVNQQQIVRIMDIAMQAGIKKIGITVGSR